MSTTPPGWYDDGQSRLRWWDGAQWTEHTHGVPGTGEPAEAGDTDAAAAASWEAEPSHAAAPPRGPANEHVAEAADDPEAPVDGAAEAGERSPSEPDAGAPEPAESDTQPAEGAAAEPPTALDPAAALGFSEPPAAGTPDFHDYGATNTGSAPAAYPGGYQAAPADPPKKSRRWVIPVIIVGAVVALIVLAAVLIPMIVGMFSGTSAGGVAASSPEEEAAISAVEQYDDAWGDADCDLLEQATTDGFRAVQGLDDCEVFVATAEQFDAAVEDYEVAITEITREGAAVTIITEETFQQVIGDDGSELDTPQPGSVVYIYTVIDDEGTWRIDNLANG